MTDSNDNLTPTSPIEVSSPKPESGLIRLYFTTLKDLLTRPTEFFSNLRLPVHPAFALVFALVTHWVGSALEYLWTMGFLRSLDAETNDWRNIFRKMADQVDSTDRIEALSEIQEKAMHWVMGAGSVMIDPFKTALKILFQSLLLWFAARILVSRAGPQAEKSLAYETSLAIVCFSMAPSILAGIPFVGSVISMLFTFVLMIIGSRVLYRVTAGRAVAIVFLPQIILLSIVLFIFAALSVALLKLAFNFVGT